MIYFFIVLGIALMIRYKLPIKDVLVFGIIIFIVYNIFIFLLPLIIFLIVLWILFGRKNIRFERHTFNYDDFENFDKEYYYNENNYNQNYSNKKDYYEILGVEKTATQSEIKKAYHKLAKKYHPDSGVQNSEELMKEVNEAYDVLGNEEKRKKYDLYY